MMIAGGFTCQRYGFNVGADKFSLLTIENGKTSIMRLSEWTLISQSQKSHSDRLLGERDTPPARFSASASQSFLAEMETVNPDSPSLEEKIKKISLN